MRLPDELRARIPVYDPRKRCAEPKGDRFAVKAERRRLRREHGTKRDRLRARIYYLDGGHCRKCGRHVYLKVKDAPHELAVGHVDEWIPRSLGGDDLEEENCLLYCAECHLLGKHRQGEEARWFIAVALDEQRLMRGPVEFIPPAPITLYLIESRDGHAS